MRIRGKLYTALGVLVATAVSLSGTSTVHADEPGRVPVTRLTDTVANRLIREGTATGPTDPSTQVTVQVFLTGDAAGLAAYARAVSNPASPRYRHFLTPAQTRARFGPHTATDRRGHRMAARHRPVDRPHQSPPRRCRDACIWHHPQETVIGSRRRPRRRYASAVGRVRRSRSWDTIARRSPSATRHRDRSEVCEGLTN
jgi:hypothetical protein